MARLQRSAERVFIELPVSIEQIGREVQSAIIGAGNAESYIRVMLTRGVGDELGLDPGLSRHPLRVVIVTPLKAPPAEQYRDGISVVTHKSERIADGSRASGAKLGNYLTAVLAQRAARLAHASEALLVDGRGCAIEGATSNVFAVLSDGTLLTPPESDGILLGITRETVLSVAADLGLSVRLESLPVETLKSASEVFICSSIRELMPVVRVDGAAIGDGRPGPVTLRLLTAFREACARSLR